MMLAFDDRLGGTYHNVLFNAICGTLWPNMRAAVERCTIVWVIRRAKVVQRAKRS